MGRTRGKPSGVEGTWEDVSFVAVTGAAIVTITAAATINLLWCNGATTTTDQSAVPGGVQVVVSGRKFKWSTRRKDRSNGRLSILLGQEHVEVSGEVRQLEPVGPLTASGGGEGGSVYSDEHGRWQIFVRYCCVY